MTDGWGDASGIEGNYEDDGGDAGEAEDDTVEPSPSAETSEPNKTRTNIKDEWNGRTIYIPDGVLDEMEDTYLKTQLKLRTAGQDEFKKNRHFYPLLVQFGIEALAAADADELQTRLSELGDE